MHTDPSGTDPSTEMIRMLFSMLAFYALASTASTPERPNVLLITAKDFVLAALGCYSLNMTHLKCRKTLLIKNACGVS